MSERILSGAHSPAAGHFGPAVDGGELVADEIVPTRPDDFDPETGGEEKGVETPGQETAMGRLEPGAIERQGSPRDGGDLRMGKGEAG